MRSAVLMVAGLLACVGPASAQTPGPAPTLPQPVSSPGKASAPVEAAGRIRLTGDSDPEEWWLGVTALQAAPGQSHPDHAVMFVGFLSDCRTPRAFPIVFTANDHPIENRGALLARQKTGDGGCVDALGTVFPSGSETALVAAKTLSIALPGRQFELSAPHLEYLRRAFAIEAVEPAGAPIASAALTTNRPLPSDPEARALANQAFDLDDEAIGLVRAGRLKDARKRAVSAVELAEKAYGPDRAQTGDFLITLGFIERKLGDNKAAAAAYQRAVRLLEAQGPSEPLGVVLDNLGRVQAELKDVDGAIASTTRAVDVLTQTLGASHMHVGFALNNLALLWSDKGDHAKALELSDRAVEVLRGALGADNPELRPFLDDQREFQKLARRK